MSQNAERKRAGLYFLSPAIARIYTCWQSIKPHSGLARLIPYEFRVRETEFFQKQVVG